MPGAGSGKRSMKGLSNKMVGVSATQKVHAAEWTGEISWVNSHHPPSAGAGGGQYHGGGDDGIDYQHPWFERNQGEMYCNLCGAFATWEHIHSAKHVARAANPQWYGFGSAAGTEYDKPWFEERDGGWYCLLCSNWATETHIACDRHRNREAAPQYYGFGAAPAAGGPAAGGPAAGGEWALAIPAAAAGASSTAGDCPDEYARPWFTEKDGGHYCELCGAWADWTHLQCERHRKRSANPEWYGFALQAQPVQQPPQDGWSKYFSTEHNCYYYHNAHTKITQWEPPYAAAEALPTPMPQASSAPVASSAAATAAAAAAAAAEPRLPTTTTTPAAKERLPAPWKEYFHSDGRAYYYNPETKVSQWEFPLEVC